MTFSNFAESHRNFHLRLINTPRYSHLRYLLIWPAILLRYALIEALNPAAQYHPIHCALDDVIPFCEGFVIFYVLWYVLIVGMHVYTAIYDVDTFRRYTKFMIISLTISTGIFLLYPSCQELRPTTFPRDNVLTSAVDLIYTMDTNTNVFPSEHAIGALAVLAAAVHTEKLRSPRRIVLFAFLAVMISLSTVFLKQHSAMDVLAAIPICTLAYVICYRKSKDA